MKRTEEIELKLELRPDDLDRLRGSPLLASLNPSAAEQETIYYDTPDGALRTAGYSLRVRRSDSKLVQTVKYRPAESGGYSERPEWERQVEQLEPDLAAASETPLRKLLAKKKVRERLCRVSETRVRRTTWPMKRAGSEIELVLDEGEVISGSRCQALCEVELELKSGTRSDLFALALEIGSSVQLRMGVLSKSERGFFLREKRKSRAKKAEKVWLEPDQSVADAFAAVVQACLRHFRLNEPLVAERRNAAALHQARVALRRLRSALTLFRPVIADDHFDRLRGELRWLSDQFGPARDLDVLLGAKNLKDRVGSRSAERRRLGGERRQAYDRLLSALASDRAPRLILELVAWAETGAWRSSTRAMQPVSGFAGQRLERRWRRVRKQGKDIAALAPDPRHQLRIDIKKLRYAAEFFWGVSPKSGRGRQREFIEDLAELQDVLGTLNDMAAAHALAPAAAPDEAETRPLLVKAQKIHDRLREQGPYWRFPVRRQRSTG